MQHTLTMPPLDTTDLESSPALNVVIAYEDFETGKHAKNTYDFLVENLGHDCQFNNQMWKFDVLNIAKLREMAAKDAAVADVIIISSHGDELPDHIKAWIEAWAPQAINTLALVALFDCDEEDMPRTQATRAYLRDVAHRGHMGFFAQPDDWPGKPVSADRFSFQRPSDFGGKTLSTLAGVVQRDPTIPRWGINE